MLLKGAFQCYPVREKFPRNTNANLFNAAINLDARVEIDMRRDRSGRG